MAAFPWTSDVGRSSIAEIEALARSADVPFTVTSTFRAGTGSYHNKSNAVDMTSSQANMAKLAGYLYQYSPYLLELFFSGGGGFFVKNGTRYNNPSDGVRNEHYDHIHCATTLSALRAASQGGLTIPAGSTGTRAGCLPAAAVAIMIVGSSFGGALWMIH